ncbi:MAG: hypothetical protein EOP19_15265, partial [Hyphomicrobiales bacterium]
MMLRSLLSSVALVATLTAAAAQPAPFDMSPESGLVTPAAPTVPTTTPAAPVEAPAPAGFVRNILPAESLRLAGEEAKSGVVVYLTEAQAAAPASLRFSVLNALVVAPEISTLNIRINQTEVSSAPIASSAAPTEIALDIPAGVLRPGANIVEFRSSQRHRTDCTVDSTYQLWTEIDGARTQLVLAGEGLGRISQLNDLGAVGVDASGNTALHIIAPSLAADPVAQSVALRLVQQIGLAIRTPKLEIDLVDALSVTLQPGFLDVVIMPAADLPPELEAARAQASAGPLAAMITLPSGANTLVISGPNWEAIARAGEAMLNAAPVNPERPRVDLPYPLPMMGEGATASLASLGLDRLEFNGRRYASSP